LKPKECFEVFFFYDPELDKDLTHGSSFFDEDGDVIELLLRDMTLAQYDFTESLAVYGRSGANNPPFTHNDEATDAFVLAREDTVPLLAGELS
jgi:hypothetical protein